MTSPRHLLVEILADPRRARALALADWNILIRQARAAALSARVSLALRAAGVADAIPEVARWHFEAAETLATKHRRDVVWELDCIQDALAGLGIEIILLKGAAYMAADLPVSRGRVFSDVDIMVPKPKIDAVETALRDAGWVPTKVDPYDQYYYRTWMHEIPPLQHYARRTVIDVHHTLVPETARPNLNAEKLWEKSVALPGYRVFSVLAPADMVLHSATHLFNEGEFEHGLRDLVDLDGLIRDFGADPEFPESLIARGQELDLRRSLFYALRYAGQMLSTPIPGKLVERVTTWGPRAFAAKIMDVLFARALLPVHKTADDALSGPARWLLYLRGHYLRMPLHLLLRHLWRKSFKRS